MVTGLVACALGIPATDGDRLQDLSDALEHAVVVRRRGRPIQDFQKANLRGDAERGVPDQPRLNVTFDEVGRAVLRPSGSTGALTVQLQRRPWLVDAAFTVILTGGDLEAIRAALIRPRWPLYLGRTGFLPSRQLAGDLVEGDDLASLARRRGRPGRSRLGARGLRGARARRRRPDAARPSRLAHPPPWRRQPLDAHLHSDGALTCISFS